MKDFVITFVAALLITTIWSTIRSNAQSTDSLSNMTISQQGMSNEASE